MKKRIYIAGNWKMYKTPVESREFVKELEKATELFNHQTEVILFVPFTSLYPLQPVIDHIRLGAQNMHQETEGAFTGEISPRMLSGSVDFILIGHSERRHVFHESDQVINEKIRTAIQYRLIPVFCVGETLAERESGETFVRITQQIDLGLAGLDQSAMTSTLVAYEPVWAIGTGENATPEQAQEVHSFIRSELNARWITPEPIPILYGGSVKPDNCRDLLMQPDVDGLLIGGASLKLDSFSAIISTANSLQ